MSKVWFITGTGRGMGVDIAKAALAARHKVVATGRNTDKVAEALGKSANLLIVKLDITKPADAESAVKTAVSKFGRIDVLVNNAANFYAGFFEELTPEQMERQLSTSLMGPMNVTRAVLPVMRKQRSGLIITISSTAGLIGFEFGTAYAASKFGLEGWMQSLQAEVEPFGIDTITVNPGFFRTELLTEESTNFAERTIEDYNERRAKQMEFWKGYNGQQSGDPAKLAQALITITSRKSRLAALLQAQMLSAQQNRWRQRFSSRPMPTVSCPLPSHTITPSRTGWGQAVPRLYRSRCAVCPYLSKDRSTRREYPLTCRPVPILTQALDRGGPETQRFWGTENLHR
jgi:NAD(P)-dependent dehydrogenase (short-subunit alcohol dehydrogenase family)